MKRVLNVDDIYSNRFLIDYIIKDYGCVKIQLPNAEGIAPILNDGLNTPVLIFLDLSMPVMDGYAFLKFWRANRRKYAFKVNIIVVSSSSYLDFKKQGYADLIEGYVVKPVDEWIINSFMDKFLLNEDLSQTNAPTAR
jgi:CheY-like chemotaxis protein